MPKRVKFELDLTEQQYHELRGVLALALGVAGGQHNDLYALVAAAEPYIPRRGDVFVPIRLSKLTPTGRQSGTYKFPVQICLDRSDNFVIAEEDPDRNGQRVDGKTTAKGSTRQAFPVEDFDFELVDRPIVEAEIIDDDDTGFGTIDPPDAESNGAGGRLSLVDDSAL